MNARVLVPWKSVSETLGDLGSLAHGSMTVEVFSGDAPGPDDLGDVVFFTVPYDRPFGTEPIPRLSGVRVVQTLTAGYDHLAGLLPGGITLCTARGLHDASTAEHALALILAAQRELPRWVRAQDEGRWEHAHTRSLAGLPRADRRVRLHRVRARRATAGLRGRNSTGGPAAAAG